MMTDKCGRCHAPIHPADPRFPAMNTETHARTVLCAHCARVVARYRLEVDRDDAA